MLNINFPDASLVQQIVPVMARTASEIFCRTHQNNEHLATSDHSIDSLWIHHEPQSPFVPACAFRSPDKTCNNDVALVALTLVNRSDGNAAGLVKVSLQVVHLKESKCQ